MEAAGADQYTDRNAGPERDESDESGLSEYLPVERLSAMSTYTISPDIPSADSSIENAATLQSNSAEFKFLIFFTVNRIHTNTRSNSTNQQPMRNSFEMMLFFLNKFGDRVILIWLIGVI